MSQILNDKLTHVMKKIKQIVKIRLYMYNTRYIAKSILSHPKRCVLFTFPRLKSRQNIELKAANFQVWIYLERVGTSTGN